MLRFGIRSLLISNEQYFEDNSTLSSYILNKY